MNTQNPNQLDLYPKDKNLGKKLTKSKILCECYTEGCKGANVISDIPYKDLDMFLEDYGHNPESSDLCSICGSLLVIQEVELY